MFEVEVKVRADRATVRDRLADLDAERVARVRQVDTYYDAPHRDFASTDEALRVRRVTFLDGERDEAGERRDGEDREVENREGDAAGPDSAGAPDETRLTYKGPLVEAESKTREEHETRVADGEAVAALLDGLGFAPAAVVEKEREVFAVGAYRVVLDRVTDLGEFVEVEREVPEDAVESAREGALSLLRDLGLDPDEQIRTSYLGLLLSDGADVRRDDPPHASAVDDGPPGGERPGDSPE